MSTPNAAEAGPSTAGRGSAMFAGRRPLVDATFLILLLCLAPLLFGDYHLRLLAAYLGLAIMAMGLDLIWGYAGILSMGQAVYFGTAGYFTAIGVERLDWPVALAIVAGVVVAVGLAAMTSALVFFSRVGAFFVAIITLAFAVLAEQVVNQFSTVTGGFNGIVVSTFSALSTTTLYVMSTAVAGVMLLIAAVIATSDFGRLLVAVRDDEQRVRFLGYRTPKSKMVIFCIGAFFAAIGGVIYTVDTQFVSPANIGFVLSTQAVIWTVIGGRRSIIGPFVGAVAISFFEQSLGGLLLDYWQLVLGVVLIVIVMFAPDGLYPTLRRLLQRRSVEQCLVRSLPGGADVRTTSALEIAGVTKRFGAFTAVRDVSLTLQPGDIVCLVGPNGAGKSTLINSISGEDVPDEGQVTLAGTRLHGSPPEKIAQQGMGRTFQTTRVFDTLTVFENLYLAAAAGHLGAHSLYRRSHEVGLPAHVATFVEKSGLRARLNDLPPALSHGERQWLELCMAMGTGAGILLLDEPTAGLTKAERTVVGETLQALAADTGLGLLLVEHDLHFVRGLATSVLVLHQGETVAFGSVEEIATNDVVRDVYLGAAT